MPSYKGTESTPIQRVYKGNNECCVFKGDTLVHPNAVMHSTTETGDWITPGPGFDGSPNRVIRTLRASYNPKVYMSDYVTDPRIYGDVYMFHVIFPGYYDIVWRATYRKSSGGGYVGLRAHRYSHDYVNNLYYDEYLLGSTTNVLVQATPVEFELVFRRQFLNGGNAVLVTSNLADSTLLESNAMVMINKVP